jgi:hypothetical protein
MLHAAAVLHVKWSRFNEYEFASAHEGSVRIWDVRVCGNASVSTGHQSLTAWKSYPTVVYKAVEIG